MKINDILKMAFQNLKRRKSRTILTVIGVVVGCCCVVTMISIGIGMENSYTQMLKNMGDLSTIQVYTRGSDLKLDDKAIANFQAIENVDIAIGKTGFNDMNVSVYAGENNRYQADWCQIVGLNADAMEKFGLELVDGAFPKEQFTVLAGEFCAYNFRDTQRPDGSNIIDRWQYEWVYNPETGREEYNENPEYPDPYFDILSTPLTLELSSYDDYETKYTQEIKVSGVVKENYNKDYATSEGLIMITSDIKSLYKMVNPTATPKNEYDEIYVIANDISAVSDVESAIKELGYNTSSMESMRQEMQGQARQIQLMLGGLGAISLFVAALSITNTMIMSISERTREIGIMKALGCFLGNIRTLFLMEAGAIGLIGGLVGAFLSYVLSIVINSIAMHTNPFGQGFTGFFQQIAFVLNPENSPTSLIPLWLAGFAVIFSILIGVVSGFYPANKAVHISALEAIKRE